MTRDATEMELRVAKAIYDDADPGDGRIVPYVGRARDFTCVTLDGEFDLVSFARAAMRAMKIPIIKEHGNLNIDATKLAADEAWNARIDAASPPMGDE